MKPALEADKMFVAVVMKLGPRVIGLASEVYARRHCDFAIASAGVLVEFDATDLVSRESVTLGRHLVQAGACPRRQQWSWDSHKVIGGLVEIPGQTGRPF